MPRNFRVVNQDFDLLRPFAFGRTGLILAGFGYNGIARLKPGVSLAQVNADMARMVMIWMGSWTNGPGSDPYFYRTWKITPAVRPLKQEVIGSVGDLLWVVMGTISVLMLIACANVSNLSLVRAEARQQELGCACCPRRRLERIVRALMVESCLLGLAAAFRNRIRISKVCSC